MADVEGIEDKIENNSAYEETYSMRMVGGGISTSVPKIVVKRKAKELGIPIEEFIQNYKVKALFDDFKNIDVAFKFVKKEDSP